MLCDDILTRIIYDHNIILTIARLVCSQWRDIIDTYGFIENITININSSFHTFIHIISKNLLSLKTLTIDSINDPVLWIPSNWPHTIIFNNCYMGNQYINPPKSNTNIL